MVQNTSKTVLTSTRWACLIHEMLREDSGEMPEYVGLSQPVESGKE